MVKQGKMNHAAERVALAHVRRSANKFTDCTAKEVSDFVLCVTVN